MNRVIEIRSYKLKPGSGTSFDALMRNETVPLLRAAKMDVVSLGLSLDQADAYFLIRAFDSVQHLRSSQAHFYGSSAWRQGPREAVVALIESDFNAVLSLSSTVVDSLRRP